MVRDRGEAVLVATQREQQVGDPVGRRKLAVGRAHAEAVHPPAAGRDQQRAGLADEPDPSAPGSSASPVSRWSSRSSWPSRSPSRPWATGSPGRGRRRIRFGRTTLAPRNAYSSGMIQACAKRGKRHRGGHRRESASRLPRDDERHRDRARPGMPDPSPAAQPARISGLAPRDRGELGKGLVCAHPPAIPPAHDHEIGLPRQLAHVRGLARPVGHGPDVTETLLIAELGTAASNAAS